MLVCEKDPSRVNRPVDGAAGLGRLLAESIRAPKLYGPFLQRSQVAVERPPAVMEDTYRALNRL